MLLQESYSSNTLVFGPPRNAGDDLEIADGPYVVRIARSGIEIESALGLRHKVFRVELAGDPATDPLRLEFDEYDFKCKHLIVVDTTTATTVGTYRLSSLSNARWVSGFYSYNEFTIEDLPGDVIREGVEIGRACVAREHRNTKVLFLLWRGLAAFLKAERKRYFFGCCSIFTRNEKVGAEAYRQLSEDGHLHPEFHVFPRKDRVDLSCPNPSRVELPNLFKMYLRMGAKVCGPPMIDHEFGTIDFFVVCDTATVAEKYRRMFFSE